jgi:2-amino-4-hydroxy-6-hydroxymethyldihydropteridine diphosphokinase
VTEDLPQTHRVALALGANLGEREATLLAAVAEIAAADGVEVVAISPVYETDPVGGPTDQPAYLNAVIVADTVLDPPGVLALAHRVEDAHGRVRVERWGARTLDVDVLAVDALTSDDPVLTLPHPRAHERAFVLVPWNDVDPDFVVPGRGRVGDLLAALPAADRSGVRPAGARPGRARR